MRLLAAQESGMLTRVDLLQVRWNSRVMLVFVAMVLACLVSKASAPAAESNAVAGRAKVVQTYRNLPLSFEANQGQADARARFIARGSGYGLYLTGQDAVLVLRKALPVRGPAAPKQRLSPLGVAPTQSTAATAHHTEGAVEASIHSTSTHQEYASDVIRMQLADASSNAVPVGENQLPGTINYFLGNDSTKWHSAVPTYSKVRYSGVYPGVDLVYYGNQQQLEYDFVVAPGASPAPIRLHFTGAKGLKVSSNGDLAIESANGTIAFRKPVVYQTVDGQRKPITGSFHLMADNSVGFTLGRYDHSNALVIDPILAYSTFFGGTNSDFVVAVTADTAGNAYVTGLTASSDFPLTAGAFQAIDYATPSNGVSTAFVSKFNSSGTALLYSTFIGGVGVPETVHNQGDYGKAIAIDAAGNAYITGYTYSSNFPVTSGAFQVTNKAATGDLATGFVTKLNPSGTALVYSTYLGGSVLDQLTSIALDASGNAYVAGVTASSDYPVTSGVVQTINKSAAANGFNYVVTKMNPSGSGLVYSTYLGGSNDNASGDGSIYWTNPIVVDKSGNAYVTGFTTSGNFPVTAGAYQTTNKSVYSATISKLNPTATALIYSTYIGGTSGGEGTTIPEGLAVDSAGNAYVAGYTSETTFPVTAGAFQLTNKAYTNTTYSPDVNQNGFISKLNPTGTALVYSTYLGGTTGPWGGDQIYDLALDSAGDAYVAGSAMSADFPVTANAYQSKNNGATHCCDYTTYTSNAFLTEMNPTGTGLIYSTYLGGGGTQNINGPGGFGDTAYGLGLGANGNVYIVGFTTSKTFPVTAGAFNTTYMTEQNMGFVANFDLGTTPATKDTLTTLTASANPVVPGTSVTFTATVAPASGTGTPTGNVVFSVDETTVATVALSAGKATYTTAGLVAGAHYILATYTGSTTYDASGDGLNEEVIPITPVIKPTTGTYTSQQMVTLTDATPGAVLYYTLDGTTPSVFSTPYTTPIIVNTTKTVKAIAVSQHDAGSAVATATYTMVGAPSVLAGPATAIGTGGATLNAFVNTIGVAGTYYFQYGTSSATLISSTAKANLAASSTRVQPTVAVTGLASKTTYYFRIVVTTVGGTVTGDVLSFTTN